MEAMGWSCWVAGEVAELGLNEEVAARQGLGEEHGAEDTAGGEVLRQDPPSEGE